MAKRGLGRGLDSLFSENSIEKETAVTVRLSDIEPNRDQPRKAFDEASLEELAESIRENGLLQPIVVRPLPGGRYGIVAGERRWRACRMAGLSTVPVTVRELSDEQAAALALIENLQREDLNPVEQAEGYRSLIERFGLTQERAAEKVGKSRSAVANSLRLLNLTDEERASLAAGEITEGHARALLALTGGARERGFALAKSGATVREVENLARRAGKPASAQKPRPYNEACLSLERALGRPVRVSRNKSGGVLHLEFYSEDELYEFARRLGGE